MLFNSAAFLLFALTFFALWPLFRRRDNPRWGFLVVASFIFYGSWDWRFLFLLIGSGLVDYFAALGMRRVPRLRRTFLVASLLANLGGLAVFKYSAFLAHNLESFLALFGVQADLLAVLPPLTLILPVGISFYTFQSMSYSIDVYRGELEPTRNPLHFFAYLAMFPQLVAGPIVRASQMLHQLAQTPDSTEEQRWQGTRLVAHGLFKKVVVADNLAPFVDAAFNAQNVPAGQVYWLVIVSMFAFQIYYDFSGYSDIARGLAKWMGYDIDLNFDHPYAATSLRDFWGRWHISLSTWFRDYIYIPLGGSRGSELQAHRNLWASFLLSGLWHGAAWNFVVWGGLHALFLSLERMTAWPQRLGRLPGGRLLRSLLTLACVWVGWIFFRASSMEQAISVLGALLGLAGQGSAPPVGKTELFFLALGAVPELYFWSGLNRHFTARNWPGGRVWDCAGVALVFAACVLLRGTGNAFIYFQF